MKQICVIGLGQFGMRLARELAKLDCEVLAIDRSESLIGQIRDHVHHAVIADVRQYDALAEFIGKKTDEVIITTSESLETSILCTLHLTKLGAQSIRAKAANEDHASILKALGVKHVISPEGEMALRMAQKIMHPDLLDYVPLSSDYNVVEIEAPERFHGKTLADLHLRRKYNVLAIALKRAKGGEVDFLPSAETVVHPGSSMVVIGKFEDIEKLPT